MKTLLTILFAFAFCSVVMGQIKYSSKKLSIDERQEVSRIARLFTEKIENTGNLESVWNDLLVSDFIERYVKQQQKRLSKNDSLIKRERMFFAIPFIKYNADLLDQASPQDWKNLYVLTYNFYHFESVSYSNEIAKLGDIKPDSDALLKITTESEKFYPHDVIRLFASHPILKDFIKNRVFMSSINTIEELKSVNETLEKALKSLPPAKLSEAARAKRQKYAPRLFFGEKAEINYEEFYGFPKGTRFINFWTPPGRNLYLAKINGEFKVILRSMTGE